MIKLVTSEDFIKFLKTDTLLFKVGPVCIPSYVVQKHLELCGSINLLCETNRVCLVNSLLVYLIGGHIKPYVERDVCLGSLEFK